MEAPMTAASPAPSSMPRPLAAWLSILLLIAVALVKTILSKTIFDQLPTPIAYSLGSAVVTWLLVALPLAYNGELKCMRPTDLWRVGLVSVAVTLDLGMSNIAIALLPLPLQQAIASAIPAATVLLESAVTRRLKPPTTYLTILLLCGGAITMHFGSIPTYQPSIGRGEVAMGLAICFAALKYVFAKASLQAWKASYGALGVLLWIETFIALQMLPWAYYSGELGLAAAILSERSVASIALLCAAAALGGFRFYCELVVLRYWSATTLSAANLMAHALIVALATPLSAILPLGAAPFTPLTLAGTAVTLIAALAYAALKLRGGLEGRSAPSTAATTRDDAARQKSDAQAYAALAQSPIMADAAPGPGGRRAADRYRGGECTLF